MIWVTLTAALASTPAATAPEVSLTWKKQVARLRVTAPAGEKVNADGPARLSLTLGTRAFDLTTDGARLAAGLELGALEGVAVDGLLEVQLCDLAGTICRPTAWTLAGTPLPSKKPVALTVAAPQVHRPFGPDANSGSATAAYDRAKKAGKPVILDFSAVWCPPCNMLADEVLETDTPELDAFEIAVLDVDHQSSFDLKSKYAIGGYPTVVVTDADGNELSRVVGYPGREAFLNWLINAPASGDGADRNKAVDELTPERAGVLAWQAYRNGERDRVEPLLARAGNIDTAEVRLARFATAPEAADLAWLLEHARGEVPMVADQAASLGPKAPELARKAVDLALVQARGSDLADALSAAAELAPDVATRQAFYRAAVGVVRSAMNGDPVHDKGYISWLSHLLKDAGDPDAAIALLEESVANYPDEPTFDLTLSPMLLELGKAQGALDSANRAVALAWGDNKLRAVLAQAEALIALERRPEAVKAINDALAAAPIEDALKVRTHRYRTKLQALLEGAP